MRTFGVREVVFSRLQRTMPKARKGAVINGNRRALRVVAVIFVLIGLSQVSPARSGVIACHPMRPMLTRMSCAFISQRLLLAIAPVGPLLDD